MLRNFFQITLLTVLLSSISFAQEEFDETLIFEPAIPRKIHEFGRTGECELGAILDNFYMELSNDPMATGYIIIYQGENVLPAEYDSNTNERRIRMYMSQRRFDESRVVFVNGGFREESANELWIAPAGADAPQPTDTIPKPTLPQGKTYLYDSNSVSFSYDGAESILADFILPSVIAEMDEQNRLAEEEWKRENPDTAETDVQENTEELVEEEIPIEQPIEQPTQEEIDEINFSWANINFGEVIKKQKGASGVIIFYADDAYYDTNKLQTFVDQGRNKIAGESEISPDKIQVIFGGFRNSVEAEFWVVPKKGEFPTPTPEQREIEKSESEEAR